jgi:hypothetical protein
MQIVVNEQLKDAIEWTCKYANEYKVDIDIHIDADGETSVSVCPTYRDTADTPQTDKDKVVCPNCGRSDYIRSFEKDFNIKNSEYRYKCINCNTYIKDAPQTDCETCKYGEDKHRYAHICNECGVGINNYTPQTELTAKCLNCHNAKACKENHWDGCIYEPQTDCGWK